MNCRFNWGRTRPESDCLFGLDFYRQIDNYKHFMIFFLSTTAFLITLKNKEAQALFLQRYFKMKA